MSNRYNYAKAPLGEKELKQLLKYFKIAVTDIQKILKRITDQDDSLTQAFLNIRLEEIGQVIKRLETESVGWADTTIPELATLGAAEVLVSLGVTKTVAEARKITQTSKLRQKLIQRRLNLCKSDILKGLSNSHNEIRRTVRTVAGKVLTEQYATGFVNNTKATNDLKKELRKAMDGIKQPYVIPPSGKRWRVEDYADMLARSHIANTHLEHTVARGKELGCKLGIISTNPNTKDACKYHEGRIVSLEPDSSSQYPYWKDLKEQIFHPRCRHRISAIYSVHDLDKDEYLNAEKQRIIGNRALEVKSTKGTMVQNADLLKQKIDTKLPKLSDDRKPESDPREGLRKMLIRNGIEPSF